MLLKSLLFNSLKKNELDMIDLIRKSADDFGTTIYLIGGIVRDLIMKNPLKDIDIAVEADAIEFAEYIRGKNLCEILSKQENLRTAKVRFSGGVEVDLASTREEFYEKNGNLPKAYNFGCKIEKDVVRRDFTINTLAIKLTGDDKYTLTDCFDGYGDIKNRIIRVLHKNSFIDDPSRIIRALKFLRDHQ